MRRAEIINESRKKVRPYISDDESGRVVPRNCSLSRASGYRGEMCACVYTQVVWECVVCFRFTVVW